MSSIQNRAIHRTTLGNGLTVIAVENPMADIIAARIFVKAGGLWEDCQHSGLAHLLMAVLTRGTDQFSALEIAEQVESMGASLGADAASDYCLLSLKSVSADFADLFQLASHLLRYPSFPDSEIELERRLTLQAIRSQREQPYSIAFNQLRKAMYPDHPYGVSGLGTEATVAHLSQVDLQQYHQAFFRPDNVVVTIVGRISASEAIALVEKGLGDWQAPASPLPALQLQQVQSHPQQVVTAQQTHQAIVMLAYLAPPVQAASYAALKLLSSYLGNGLSSRLFVELREKRGLAYEVSSFYPTRLESSQFVTYLGTAPENTAIALQGLEHEVARLCHEPLSPAELQAAKNKLLGQYALGKQTNAQIAQVLGWYEALGLGVDFDLAFQEQITAVTAEAAEAAAQHFLTLPYISLVGPDEAIALTGSSNAQLSRTPVHE
jgi:predicted Zn-dependent peptidase